MTCYLMFLSEVARKARVSRGEAEGILRALEGEVGHNKELIKAVVDAESGEALRARLRKRVGREKDVAYA